MRVTRVSAVCQVRDGYTGRLISTEACRCTLDGQPCVPVRKRDGYLILTDVPAGSHCLVLQVPGYQPERVEWDACPAELNVLLKPGAGYPLARTAVSLLLQVTQAGTPVPGRYLWLAAPFDGALKLAQTQAEAGTSSFRLFWKGAAEQLSLPGSYLLLDGEHSEIVTLRTLSEETGTTAAPLRYRHGRSCQLLPAQRYETDSTGTVRALFRTAGTVQIYEPEQNQLQTVVLAGEETRTTVALEVSGGT